MMEKLTAWCEACSTPLIKRSAQHRFCSTCRPSREYLIRNKGLWKNPDDSLPEIDTQKGECPIPIWLKLKDCRLLKGHFSYSESFTPVFTDSSKNEQHPIAWAYQPRRITKE